MKTLTLAMGDAAMELAVSWDEEATLVGYEAATTLPLTVDEGLLFVETQLLEVP